MNVQFFVFRFHFVLVCRIANGIVTLCLRNDWNNWLTGCIQCIMQELNWNECKCDVRLKCTIGIDSFCVLISNYTRFVHRKCQTIKIKTIALEMPITAHAISDWCLAMAILFCFFLLFWIAFSPCLRVEFGQEQMLILSRPNLLSLEGIAFTRQNNHW